MKYARLISLALVVVVCGLYAVEGYLAIRSQREIVAQDERRDLLSTGRTATAAAAELWKAGGEESARDLLERISLRAQDLQLEWIDLSRGSESKTGLRVCGDVMDSLRRGEEHADTSEGGIGDRFAEACLPVVVDGEVVGGIALEAPVGSTPALARGTVQRTAISVVLTIGALVGAFFLGWGFARRPSKDMIEKARGIILSRTQTTNLSQIQKDRIAQLGLALDVLSGEIEDTTRRLEAETNVRLATLEQLRHADRLKTVGQLTSGILHELGTPLTIISGRCKMVADGEVEGDEAADSARIAVEQTERITRMVRGILDFARRGRRAETSSDLGELARLTIRLMNPMALKHGVTLRWEGDEGRAEARFDASQIQQVTANLVLNAIQASPGGGEVTVSLERVEAPRHDAPDDGPVRFWALHVSDRGTGIAPEMLDRIFESFFTTKSEGEGTGLGLTISKQIISDHGGWLAVSSEIGHGSRFTVHLPCEEATT